MSNVSMIDGHIDQMTDKEIIKALECCSSPKANCEDCPCFNKDCISTTPYVLDLINRQQAEIEKLEKVISYLEDVCNSTPDKVRAEATKEFAERLDREFAFSSDTQCISAKTIRKFIQDELKEMVGEDK